MAFTRLTSATFANTLTRRLVPVADSIRDLSTKVGLRPYQVRRVWTIWSGGRRGVGMETVLREELIEPTPKLGALDALTEQVIPVGTDEQGELVLDKISGRYTEEDLRGFTVTGNGELMRLEQAHQFYYEVEFFGGDAPSVRRRFYISGTPSYYPGRLCWQVRLVRAREDRTRDGDVS